jgi:hypothetical protein
MSYLGLPRLHFYGRFQADPSTINNDPKHHDNDTFEPRFQRPEAPGGLFSSWNPTGSAAFRLKDCVVTSVIGLGGDTLITAPEADRLVGGVVADDNHRVSAKIVDLDSYQQATAEVFGLRVRLLDNTGAQVLAGDFAHTPFVDFWFRYPQAPSPLLGAGTIHSVLENVEFSDTRSPVAAELKAGSTAGLLSIKFNVDGFVPDVTSPTFSWGRVVGSIGCYREGEPRHLVAGRRLRTQPGSPLNHASCRIDKRERRLYIDLGNSIPTTASGGPVLDPGQLQVVLLSGQEPPVPLVSLGGVGDELYRTQAGIVSLLLDEDQVEGAAKARLAIMDSTQHIFLAENSDATWVGADSFAFRLYPGKSSTGPTKTAKVKFYATRYGEPAAHEDIRAWGSIAPPPLPSGAPIPSPPEGPATRPPLPGLNFDARVRTDSHGQATLRLTATDPGQPRPPLDGQVYMISYKLGAEGPGEGLLSVLVWSDYELPERVDWITDVQPILQQYANLFPVMRTILDLSNYHDVVAYREWMVKSLSEPMESPSHMPVTRDLSPGKRDAIIKWLKTEPDPPVLRVNNIADLHRILQLALQLEHATVPVYLASLFSIRPDRNLEVARIIRSVVVQEMLHIALVGNILNAVGGRPNFGRPGFVPQYPGHLPGAVLPDLVVSLRKCSIDHVRDVFMGIEQPEKPINTDALRLLAPIQPREIALTPEGSIRHYGGAGLRGYDESAHQIRTYFAVAEYRKFTIGWFYQKIARALSDLEAKAHAAGKTLFTGDRARQVAWPTAPGRLFRVTDLTTALWSIYEIIHQGEGSPDDPTEGPQERDDLAHFYRFQQIVKGRQLIRVDGRWVFEGDPVPFDPDGVYPMVDDPDTYALPPQSPVREASLLCDELYGDLLTALGEVFDGHPEDFDAAVHLMFSLQVQAKKLLGMPIAPGAGTVAGPSFQVPGVT